MQGEILKKLVKEKGFNQDEFSTLMGISRNYLFTLFEKTEIQKKYLDKAIKILHVNKNVFENVMTTEMDGLNYRTSNHHGDKLRLLLRAKGVNQEAFAKSIGISRGYLQHILNKKKFQPEFIIAVCTELKIPASSFPEVDVDLSGILKEHSDDEIKKDLELKMLRIRVKDLEEINKLLKEKLNSGKNGSATTAKKG